MRQPATHSRRALAALLLPLTLLILCSSAASEEEALGAGSAWEALLAERPEAVEDPDVSPLERRILQVLTPKQAEAFVSGRPPEEVILAGGETLKDFIDRTSRLAAAGLLYKPLVPCRLLDTRRIGKTVRQGEVVNLMARGPQADYSGQGGKSDGCGVQIFGVVACLPTPPAR